MSTDRRRWEERYEQSGRGDAAPRRDAGEALGVVQRAPSAFLVTHAELIIGRVLDVAGGDGRNALYLARGGNAVEIFDIALSGLQLAKRAAAAAGLQLLAVQADLETYPLPEERYDAAINIRYLQRSLFEPLQHAVKRGGLILFETFLIDQQTCGHPRNPAFLLQRGELREAFRACHILVYEEGCFEESGTPAYLARMLARRPRD